MTRTILVKLGRLLFTLWLVVTLAFLALNLTGDPVEAILGAETDPRILEHYRAKYGLDRPVGERYVHYFADVLRGDFGFSLLERRPAFEVVIDRVPKTLELGAAALLISLLVGLPLGVVAALQRGKLVDRAIMVFAVLGFSVPSFLFGIVMIFLFSMTLKWLPSSGSATTAHLIMPALALGLGYAGVISRFSRSAMLEVLSRAYMRAATAKGAGPWRRTLWHALPNAMVPMVTILGFRLGELVSGTIVVEVLFAWPGVGRLLASSVSSRDIAVVQGILITTAAAMVIANFLADLAYRYADPRLRRPQAFGGLA